MHQSDRVPERVPRAPLLAVGGAVLIVAALALDVLHDGALSRRDPRSLQFFVDHRTPALITVARWITRFGSYWVLFATGAVAAIVLRRRGTALRVAIAPLLALVVDGILVTATKNGVGRLRPPMGTRLIVLSDRSFPSGHAADSTALYLALALVGCVTVLRRPRARVAVVALAALWCGAIGLTRLVLGVHWPTDVVAGWWMGFTVAMVVAGSAVRSAQGAGIAGGRSSSSWPHRSEPSSRPAEPLA